MDSWVIWLVFGLLILALVGFLVFSFVKDKMKNKKIIQKRNELRRATIKSSKELAVRIYCLIKHNEEFLKEVQPGFSKIKMKHVTSTARNFLKSIYDSKAFKALYIDSKDADPEYSINIKKLIDTNSNLWSKYCQYEIDYFKNLYNGLKNDSTFEEIKNESVQIINDFYSNEIKVNNEHTK